MFLSKKMAIFGVFTGMIFAQQAWAFKHTLVNATGSRIKVDVVYNGCTDNTDIYIPPYSSYTVSAGGCSLGSIDATIYENQAFVSDTLTGEREYKASRYKGPYSGTDTFIICGPSRDNLIGGARYGVTRIRQ